MAMLLLLIEKELIVDCEAIGPEAVDAIIFSDTGAEWPHTYGLIPRVRKLCARHGLRFLWLRKPRKTGPLGWARNRRAKGSRETPAWVIGGSIEAKARNGSYHLRLPILDEYERFEKLAIRNNSSCTSNHKVGPIRRAMNDLSLEKYGINNRQWSHRIKTQGYPQHRVLIGIAADEAARAIDTGRPAYERPVYPLVTMGIDKAGEAAILARHGFAHVQKSGCYMCPFQGAGWYWVLRDHHPKLWDRVVAYERTALAKNPKMNVVGKTPLPQAVAAWRQRNPHATAEAVINKSYSRCRSIAPPDPNQLAMFADAGAE